MLASFKGFWKACRYGDLYMLLVALSFYATGSYQRLVGGTQGTMMSQQSVSRALSEVTDALNSESLLDKWLRFPHTRQQRNQIKTRFYEKFKIPSVIGCIDGTHVAIIRPSQNEERFYNRKGYHSRNVLIVLAALAAQSINISVGFCQGFSAVLLPQYTHEYPNITDEQSSWIASLGVISNPVGALLGGMMVDAVGRRLLLQSIVLPNLIGWLVIAFSETYIFLCVGRFITGFTIGMSTVSYIYVAEITTPEKRGVLSALGPGLVSTGIFVVYSLGAFVHWRKVAAICAGFSLLTPFLMYFVPESPLWLASKGYMKEAYSSMFWLRQNNNTAQQELMEFTKDRKIGETMSFKQKMGLFKRRSVLKPFIVLIVFFIFQEMSGIYVILYYAVDFFKSVGTSVNEFTASIIVGGVRVFMGAVGACLINSFRRKTLAATSGLLLGVAMLGAAICDTLDGPPLVKLACVLLHVSFSMVGFLQLPWIMSGELYPQEIRGVMSGATSCCAYVLIFFNIKTYPQLENLLTSNGTLYLFGGCALLGAAYCYFFLPETKGKTLNEIMRQFDEKKEVDPEAGYKEKKNSIDGRPVQRRHSAGAAVSLEKNDIFATNWVHDNGEKTLNLRE